MWAEDFTVYALSFTTEHLGASQVVLVVKNPPAKTGDKRRRLEPCVGKISWRRAWQPTPVFLLGELDGQSNLEGYSP